MAPVRFAVIGGGISGLTAAYLLSQRFEVTLFEANKQIGGHTHTVDVTTDSGTRAIDMGFIVFNNQTQILKKILFIEIELIYDL